MKSFLQFISEHAKPIPPINREKTDRLLQRQPTLKQATSKIPFLSPGGSVVGQFKSGSDNISVVHTPHAGGFSGKYTFHDTHDQHPIASMLYKRNRSREIYDTEIAAHSQYPNPSFLTHATNFITKREKIKLDQNKLELTPEGKRLHDALKRRGKISEESKLLNKKTKTLEQIADKHGVSIDKLSRELKMGIETEKEHTTHSEVAREIALDHLDEKPDYYTMLKMVEKKH